MNGTAFRSPQKDWTGASPTTAGRRRLCRDAALLGAELRVRGRGQVRAALGGAATAEQTRLGQLGRRPGSRAGFPRESPAPDDTAGSGPPGRSRAGFLADSGRDAGEHKGQVLLSRTLQTVPLAVRRGGWQCHTKVMAEVVHPRRAGGSGWRGAQGCGAGAGATHCGQRAGGRLAGGVHDPSKEHRERAQWGRSSWAT